MINRGTFDRVDEAIDEFEASWSLESNEAIEDLVSRYGLSQDHDAIAELIRVDIELRYENGDSCEVDHYLDRFGQLRDQPECVAEIAFEDFRARSAMGYPVSAARWKNLPGVHQEPWFQDLARSARRKQIRSQIDELQQSPGEDAAFQAELAAVGFQLVQQIGTGAFSHVYLANQSELADRFVVLKIVSETLAEPERMATLQHTNIVPIYSSHRVLSRTVICMPYAGSVTLADFLASRTEASQRSGESLVGTVEARIQDTMVMVVGDDDEEDSPSGEFSRVPAADDLVLSRPLDRFKSLNCDALALSIFSRLANALSHAHIRGVLHNDLKPSNVLIRNDGEPALLDFNLSQAIGQKTNRRAGGTLPYMSPEMLRALMGAKEQPDATSDLYSLGVMMFEFMTGRLPYSAPASIAEIDLAPAVSDRKSAPGWLAQDQVTPGLRSIIDRCLHFDPKLRYQSADDLHSDLVREQDNRALKLADEPLGWRARKWSRRHPRLLSALVAGVLLLGIVGPVSIALRNSRITMDRLGGQHQFAMFYEASSRYLSEIMADPGRHAPETIRRGFDLIEEHELSSRDQMDRLIRSLPFPQQQKARDGMFIYIAHLAFLEQTRLWRKKTIDGLVESDFESLDHLISLADFLDGDSQSRARLHLQAQRARLFGDTEEQVRLSLQANDVPANTDTEVYLDAVRLLAIGDYVSARDMLAILADRDTVPSALRWTMLGRAQFLNDRFDEAKLSFTQSIERAPNSAELRVLRGRCHYRLGQTVAADQDFRRAAELEPDNPSPWYYLGYLQRDEEQYESSLKSFQQAKKLAPDRIRNHLQVSRAYRLLEEDEKADEAYEQAFSLECIDTENLLTRAQARIRTKDYELALADFQEALQMNPDSPFLLLQVAWAQATYLERYIEAVENYKHLLEVQPYDENVLISLALAYLRLEKFDLATAYARKAMDPPNSPRTIYQAACIHAVIGRPFNRQRALALLAEAVKNGYPAEKIDTDPDLDSIRDTEEFESIRRFLEASQRSRRNRR
ncbi:protein kinase [Stieleria sp. JC731]|uniref:serine/threonine-protein kinase n=1 Tax=Pirellulaceae TaxID=2691357 RepID=UPI001E534F71|nr:serine/threonine-protein kinase [Stieleria sp. JC731]MCC9600168.1 protein kinase [Stieleria sp. JC731]